MAEQFIDLSLLPSQNPVVTIPEGYRIITGSGSARIDNGRGYTSKDNTYGGWETVDTAVPASNVISAEIEYYRNATNDGVVGVTFLSSGTTGYGLVSEGFNQRLVRYSTGISSYTSLGIFGEDRVTGTKYKLSYNTATGELILYRNGTSVLTRTDTTYLSESFNAGFLCRAYERATVKTFTSYNTSDAPTREITSITDPIIFGEPLIIETTGFTDPTSITAAGMTAVIDSFEDGVIAATWPALFDGTISTVALPAVGVEVTVTEEAGSATTTANIDLQTGFAAVEFENVSDNPRYIGGNDTLVDGWYGYFATNQPGVGNVDIKSDGEIWVDNAGTVTVFLHKLGDDNSIEKVEYRVDEAGIVTGLSLKSKLKRSLKQPLKRPLY